MPIGVYKRTEYHKSIISKVRQGTSLSYEIRQKISETEMGKKVSDKTKRKMSEARIGMEFSKKHKYNISKAHKKRFARMTIEEKRKYFKSLLLANKEAWSKLNNENRLKRVLPMIIAAQKASPSSIERMIWKELDKLDISFEIQVSFAGGRFIIGIYIPAQRLIIECNGDYWHNYKIFPKKKIRDRAVEGFAIKNDYKLIWLWESDIRKNPKQTLENGFKKIFERS